MHMITFINYNKYIHFTSTIKTSLKQKYLKKDVSHFNKILVNVSLYSFIKEKHIIWYILTAPLKFLNVLLGDKSKHQALEMEICKKPEAERNADECISC